MRTGYRNLLSLSESRTPRRSP